MIGTIERAFHVGDGVVIPEAFGTGSGSWFARVTDQEAHSYCIDCHCCPPDPEHLGDGSACCPGPFYMVVMTCPDNPTHEHLSAYAEHELTTGPCASCGRLADACSWSQNPRAGLGDCCTDCKH